ncbi:MULTISPECIES: tripartite tricarboxylate transporter substrate binding protein [unclassified Cupriavidus]|uniref:Bug family tripartite tricarboxylate transporter substrate binding protein n=1 Tax=unclassified Cupriavidus TaxID=2640874 RepID=UPI00295EC355|nr:tripartite tricarboxylate transporter substrate binding protein [Cupriavidus sp. TA19]
MTMGMLRLRRRQTLGALMLATTLALGPTFATAQGTAAGNYPNRPVTIIVPFAAGGGTDIVARMLGNELSKRWKTSVVVENKPGASGQIGNAMVARAKPDGYTLLVSTTAIIQEPSLYKHVPYAVFKDFTPLAQIATSTSYLVVPASTPVQNVDEFVAYAKSRKGHISYGSNGNGGSAHLQGSLFNVSNQLDMVHVPYAGSAPLITALLGKQVDAAVVDISSLRAHLQSDKLKILAGTGQKRNPLLPQVPTLKEKGFSGFEPIGWYAILGPAGLPEPLKQTISDALQDALKQPAVIKRIEELGLTPAPLPADAFVQQMKADSPQWERMIKAGNVTIE